MSRYAITLAAVAATRRIKALIVPVGAGNTRFISMQTAAQPNAASRIFAISPAMRFRPSRPSRLRSSANITISPQ